MTAPKACEGKIKYASENAANRVRRNRQKAGAGRMLIYHCPDCHGWHLSSRPTKSIWKVRG